MSYYTIRELFDLRYTAAAELFEKYVYPWEILSELKAYICLLGVGLPADRFTEIKENVWAANTAVIAGSASITGPCVIDENAEIRHCAFIRGGVIVGRGAVVGNSTELKNAVLFDKVQVPHYNYVGDSVLGYRAHMGAGAVTSNVKSDKTPVCVHAPDGDIKTGLKKCGAMLGDGAEIGCGSVLNPGTVIGKNTNVYPLSCVRGCVPPDSIFKSPSRTVRKEQRE